MANRTFDDQVNDLLTQLNTPLTLPGHLIVKPLACDTPEQQLVRNAAIVEAHTQINVPRQVVKDTAYYSQTASKSSSEIVGKAESNDSSSTYFENSQQARVFSQWLAQQGAPPASYDPTMPTSDSERKELIAQLTAAFMSIKVDDDSTTFDGSVMDSQSKQISFANHKYDMRMVEARSWEILELMEEKKLTPQSLIVGYGYENKKDDKERTTYEMSFQELFDGVVLLLRSWKAQAERLLEAPFLRQVVQDPPFRLERGAASHKSIEGRKSTNKRLRQDSAQLKAEVNDTGTALAKTGSQNLISGELEENDIPEMVPPPVKLRKVKTPAKSKTSMPAIASVALMEKRPRDSTTTCAATSATPRTLARASTYQMPSSPDDLQRHSTQTAITSSPHMVRAPA